MNANSLYVSTCRLVMLGIAEERSTWSELYRLVPHLRQSLSCTICGNLLRDPFSPTGTSCAHNVCKLCLSAKNAPSCNSCKKYDTYVENLRLRILVQCYKNLCEYLTVTDIYKIMMDEDDTELGRASAEASLVSLIQEGARFVVGPSDSSLSVSAISKLPCIYTYSSSTQTDSIDDIHADPKVYVDSSKQELVPKINGLFSSVTAFEADSGSLVAHKEMKKKMPSPKQKKTQKSKSQSRFKKPKHCSSASGKRKECRCGNATPSPGKLTCCGQRCPCYVEGKACTQCKCKGCRNPHRADGQKVIRHIPTINLQLLNADVDIPSPVSMDIMDSHLNTIQDIEESYSFDSCSARTSNIKVYTNQLLEISPSLPASIMMDEEDSSQEDSHSPQQEDSGSPQEDSHSPQEDFDPLHAFAPPSLFSYESSEMRFEVDDRSADVLDL